MVMVPPGWPPSQRRRVTPVRRRYFVGRPPSSRARGPPMSGLPGRTGMMQVVAGGQVETPADALPEAELRHRRVRELLAAVGRLAEAGLPNDRGVGRETADRLFRRLLPTPRDEGDLANLLLRLFPSARERRWLENMAPDLFHRLVETLGALPPLGGAAAEALCLVAGRVQALGLSQAIRARSEPGPVRASPFFALPRRGDEVLAHLDAPAGRTAAERAFRDASDGCRKAVAAVLSHLEATGVSID